MRIAQTNRRLYACLNRKECAQRRQKQLEKLLATVPHPERMVPMISRPSPQSNPPPGQRPAVPVAQAAPVAPVGVPVPQPIGGHQPVPLPQPRIAPYLFRRRYQYETGQPRGRRRIVGQWTTPQPQERTTVPDPRVPSRTRIPDRPRTRVPVSGPRTPPGSPVHRETADGPRAFRTGPSPPKKPLGPAAPIPMVVPDEAKHAGVEVEEAPVHRQHGIPGTPTRRPTTSVRCTRGRPCSVTCRHRTKCNPRRSRSPERRRPSQNRGRNAQIQLALQQGPRSFYCSSKALED